MSAAFEKIKAGLEEALVIAPYIAEIERLKDALARAEAERDAARDNAELMNAAATRHLRRAIQAEKALGMEVDDGRR